jgi:hypothetical protein
MTLESKSLSQVWIKCSQTRLLIFILLRGTTGQPIHCDTTENQKASVARQECPQFDTITPPLSRDHTPNFLYCVYLLSQNNCLIALLL